MSRKSSLLFIICLICFSSNIFACSLCSDHSKQILEPIANEYSRIVFILFLPWLLISLLLCLFTKRPENSSFFTYPGREWLIIGFVMIVFLFLGLAAGGTGPMEINLTLGKIWGVYLALSIVFIINKWNEEKPGRPIIVFCISNIIFVLLAITMIASIPKEQSLKQRANLLRWHITFTVCNNLMPELIAKQPQSIDSIIRVADDHYPSAILCLAMIKGEKVNNYLEKTVERLTFSYNSEWKKEEWERFVLFAYADCLEEQAVAKLIEIYQQKLEINSKIDILLALLKTGSKEGIMFILENIHILLQNRNQYSNGQILDLALIILFSQQDLAKLKDFPIYKSVEFIYTDLGLSPNSVAPEYYWLDEKTPRFIQPAFAGVNAIKKQWLKVFAEDKKSK